MISTKAEKILSILSPSSPDMEPMLGSFGDGDGRRGQAPRAEEAKAALGFVSKFNPLAADLLFVAFTVDTHYAKPHAKQLLIKLSKEKFNRILSDVPPAIVDRLTDLGLIELTHLIGASRCQCRGLKPICDLCNGTGTIPKRALSERARVRFMQDLDITRYAWGNKYAALYDVYLDELLELLLLGCTKLRQVMA